MAAPDRNQGPAPPQCNGGTANSFQTLITHGGAYGLSALQPPLAIDNISAREEPNVFLSSRAEKTSMNAFWQKTLHMTVFVASHLS